MQAKLNETSKNSHLVVKTGESGLFAAMPFMAYDALRQVHWPISLGKKGGETFFVQQQNQHLE